MKDQLEGFLKHVPHFHAMSQRERVAFFAFFLTEILKDPWVRASRIRECFDLALVPAPGNVSDVIAKSGSFVNTKGGLQLRRDIREQILETTGIFKNSTPVPAVLNSNPSPIAEAPTPTASPVPGISKKVMVVYGRDLELRDSMYNFLRALKLDPIEWSEGVKATGKGSPYVGEILNKIFEMAQAVVVLLTPDEEVRLRRELCADEDEFERETGFQPRANVLIEAGMALARAENRTILVEVGSVRLPSDIQGRHIVRLNNSPEKRNELAQRLRTAGCEPDTANPDWYRIGKFEVNTKKRRGGK